MTPSQNNRGRAPVPTVNFHLVRHCNMRCGFCFAKFEDVKRDTGVAPLGLPTKDAAHVIRELAGFGFQKITFAGGEPTLRTDLPELIALAKGEGMLTAVVTNASRIDESWIARTAPNLDQMAFSVDSGDPLTRIRMGRAVMGRSPVENARLFALADALRSKRVQFKLNSVITAMNVGEDMSEFVRKLAPARWKIFQALRVEGQNESEFDRFSCPDEEFDDFVDHHRAALHGTRVSLVPENNSAMTASYAMVDPFGRFFDNSTGVLRYSSPVLRVGAANAFSEIRFDEERFSLRGGYDGALLAN